MPFHILITLKSRIDVLTERDPYLTHADLKFTSIAGLKRYYFNTEECAVLVLGCYIFTILSIGKMTGLSDL